MLLILAPAGVSFAQTAYLPPTWSQWQNYLPMINPATNGTKGDMEFLLGNQRYLGIWRNNQGYFANGNLRLQRKNKETAFHVVGLQLVADKEGEYLQRTKIYGQYAFHLQARKNLWLATGAALGAMSYSVGSADLGFGGTSTVPDGSVGLLAYGQGYFVGLSGNQLLQLPLQPLREQILPVRYFNFMAEKDIVLSPFVTFKPSLLVRWPPGYSGAVSLGGQVRLAEWVQTGINLSINREATFVFGIADIAWGQALLKGSFAYRVPMGSYAASNQQSFEIMVGVTFNKKKKEEKQAENEEAE